MAAHIYTSIADPENHLYPDTPEFEHSIECLGGCSGWQECQEDKHEVPGYDGVNDGPYESDEDAPWYDEEEYEFHGVLHTWNGSGYGWTVEFPGCVVQANDYGEPYGANTQRDGSWLVDDDWDDTYVTLNVVTEVEDERTKPGLPIRVEGKVSKHSDAPSQMSVAAYFTTEGVPREYAVEYAGISRRIDEVTSAAVSASSVLQAANAGVPAAYAHQADTYASMFHIGEARGNAIVELYKAGVTIEYIQAGMAFWVAPAVLTGAFTGGVPLEYLEPLTEALKA